MRLGLVWERKDDFPFESLSADDANSELLSHAEEDELLSGFRDAGHTVVRIGDGRALLHRIGYWRNRCDLVFNRSVGYLGVERKLHVPAVLEIAGIPYVGSTPYVLGLTRNKLHAKLVVRNAGVATPSAALVREGLPSELEGLVYPAIVKPLAESSSIGIVSDRSIVAGAEAALRRAAEVNEQYRQPALVETFVRGLEVEVPLLADPSPRALGVCALSLDGRLVDGDRFLAGDVVYGDSYGFASPPAGLDTARVVTAAVAAATALEIRDYGRIDFRVGADGTPWFIEASTHPHIQRHSSFFHLAKARGRRYHEMLAELIEIATRRIGLAPTRP